MRITRSAFIILSVLVLAVIAVGSILLTASRPKHYALGNPVATNVRFPDAPSGGEVRFFSGSAFAAVNLADQKTRALSSFHRLPNVTDVRWGKTGALFLAGNYDPLDELYPLLQQRGLATDDNYWWHIDFATNAINLVGEKTPLSQGESYVGDALWDQDGQSYYFTWIAQSDPTTKDPAEDVGLVPAKVYMVSADDSIRELGSAEASSLVWAGHDQIMYRTTVENRSNLNKLEVASGKHTTLFSNFNGDAEFNPNGTSLLTVTPGSGDQYGKDTSSETTSGTLRLLNLSAHTDDSIKKDYSGAITWQDNEWLTLSRTDASGYMSHGTKVSRIVLDGAGASQAQFTPVGIGSGNTIVAADENNQLYVAGSTHTYQKLPSSVPLRKNVLNPDQYSLEYDSSRDEFDVYLYQNVTVNSAVIIKYIREKGLDPYQLNLRWYSDTAEPLT